MCSTCRLHRTLCALHVDYTVRYVLYMSTTPYATPRAVPDDQVVVFDQRVQVSLLAADVQHDGDGVGVFGRQLLRLLQQHRGWEEKPQGNTVRALHTRVACHHTYRHRIWRVGYGETGATRTETQRTFRGVLSVPGPIEIEKNYYFELLW